MFAISSQNGRSVSRQEWEVVGQGEESARLVEQLVRAASALAATEVGAESVESFELLQPFAVGQRLLVTAAIERVHAQKVTVSLVVRRLGPTPPRPLIAVAVIGLSAEPTALRALALPAWGDALPGRTPVSTLFPSATAAQPLSAQHVIAWLHASALVSAQGATGGRVRLIGFRAVSLRVPLTVGGWVGIQCSVVRAQGGEVTVLSHLRDDASGVRLLTALSRYRC